MGGIFSTNVHALQNPFYYSPNYTSSAAQPNTASHNPAYVYAVFATSTQLTPPNNVWHENFVGINNNTQNDTTYTTKTGFSTATTVS